MSTVTTSNVPTPADTRRTRNAKTGHVRVGLARLACGPAPASSSPWPTRSRADASCAVGGTSVPGDSPSLPGRSSKPAGPVGEVVVVTGRSCLDATDSVGVRVHVIDIRHDDVAALRGLEFLHCVPLLGRLSGIRFSHSVVEERVLARRKAPGRLIERGVPVERL